ncbi:MAG TPA: cupin domain-containing protein [Chloroflexota bacterium]|jgi:mannose-6-phosphate isomerase-like protein (cupin superfamily)|nr:cupin domain-containing protein [Chloroflexota bacterium]
MEEQYQDLDAAGNDAAILFRRYDGATVGLWKGEPIVQSATIVPALSQRGEGQRPIAADGMSFAVHEWRGSGPAYLHVHYADDEAWHVLEGNLRFRFADEQVEAAAGATVYVPAGVPHAYEADAAARYLIILTPRLRSLIAELQGVPVREHQAIMRRYESEVLE